MIEKTFAARVWSENKQKQNLTIKTIKKGRAVTELLQLFTRLIFTFRKEDGFHLSRHHGLDLDFRLGCAAELQAPS